MRKTAIFAFANDKKSEAEISDSDVDIPLSVDENEIIAYDDSTDEEGETTT